MDGKQLLAGMKRLSEVQAITQVQPLSHAVFPGPHCPLMGAMMAVRGIRDAYMLVVGTDECTYYNKMTTLHSADFGGVDGRCLSVALDQHDVTFGCRDTLFAAFDELMAQFQPAAVFLVTTCIVEIIGDDVDAMAAELEAQYGVPVLPVHTEHFKTENHIPGVRDAVTACFALIEPPTAPNGRVNVIGQRMGDLTKSELFSLLDEAGVPVGMLLPGGASVEDIRRAANARVNLVVHPLGLPLAEKMREQYGVPYVLFDKYIHPARIYRLYQQLFGYLGLPLPQRVETQYAEALRRTEAARAALSGLCYIYGNTAIDCFELNAFLVELGMEPLLIQTNEIPPQDDENLRAVLAKYDPYVTKTANIAPLQYIYDVLRPNLYLGHEFALRLREKGIVVAQTDAVSPMLGLEVTLTALDALIAAGQDARSLREQEASA